VRLNNLKKTIEEKLIKLKMELGAIAPRSPQTVQGLKLRKLYDRVYSILVKRYGRFD
tara:strand:- start:55 stop:225 length:171 start_codon:yes stop_codon:yes gene_type:complete